MTDHVPGNVSEATTIQYKLKQIVRVRGTMQLSSYAGYGLQRRSPYRIQHRTIQKEVGNCFISMKTELTSGINLVKAGSVDLQNIDHGDQFKFRVDSRDITYTPYILYQRMLFPWPKTIDTFLVRFG